MLAVRHSVPESPALDRLLRYEASLDRSFDKTLSQLEPQPRKSAPTPGAAIRTPQSGDLGVPYWTQPERE
jgi:hypothetical protein